MQYYQVEWEGKPLVIRDMEEADIESLVDYWHLATPDYIRSIGALPEKLPSRNETTEMFRRSLEFQPGHSGRAVFMVQHGDKLVGYTLLNIDEQLTAYAHVHIIESSVRRRGLGRFLFQAMIAAFGSCGIERLFFQTSPENKNINNLLAKFGLSHERIQLDDPDGMARPGIFYLYKIDKELMSRLIKRETEESGTLCEG